MSPRETRTFAPSKPSDRENTEWYFQRFVPHLPSGGQFMIFNRSWYNRAGVERVMGFCSEKDVEMFFDTVNDFESLLIRSGLEMREILSRHQPRRSRRQRGSRNVRPIR